MQNANMLKSPIDILLVEDNEIDVEAVERAFDKAGIKCSIHTACDGVEALSILRSNKIAYPYLVIIDINMPRMNGIQFLQEIRQDERLKSTVIFVLTTSNRSDDRLHAYTQNIAGYFLKDRLDILVKTLGLYQQGNEFPDLLIKDH